MEELSDRTILLFMDEKNVEQFDGNVCRKEMQGNVKMQCWL